MNKKMLARLDVRRMAMLALVVLEGTCVQMAAPCLDRVSRGER